MKLLGLKLNKGSYNFLSNLKYFLKGGDTLEIRIFKTHVEIPLNDSSVYHISWESLDRVEKAIKIIRSIQALTPAKNAVIEID